MAVQLDVPLPEITSEEFLRAWTRFELVASAKEWNEAKQKSVLPTLLRGKLVDYFVELSDETKADLQAVKQALMKKAGLVKDPLLAGRLFITRDQGPSENVAEFAEELKKLFVQAYPAEALTSAILLQRFITGLRAPISRQLLLRGKPESLKNAVKDACEIEYAMNFEVEGRKQEDVNVVHQKPKEMQPVATHLQDVESIKQDLWQQIDKRMEAMETKLEAMVLGSSRNSQPKSFDPRSQRGHWRGRGRGVRRQACWLCQEEGHFKDQCPLNYKGPVRSVGDWPRNH